MHTVDVHTHFIPPGVLRAVRRGAGFDGMTVSRAGGREWLVHRQGFRYPVPAVFYDLDARLASMDERGISHAVLSIAPQLFMYWVDGGEAAGFCRAANDALAAFAAGSAGRVTAVATLPLQDPAAAVTELRRAVTGLGMAGAEVGPDVAGTPLDDPALRPVLAAAADLGVPLIVHPYYVAPRPGLADFYLTNLVGNPLATTVCAARLIFSGVLDELAALRIVLMHGGGYLPYQIGRLDHGHRVRPEARGCAHPPSAYLTRFWFDTVTHAPAPLRFLVDLVGADHVVYGTDFPFDMAAGPLQDQIAGTGLTGADLDLIAHGNAATLFGLNLADLRAGASFHDRVNLYTFTVNRLTR